MIRSLLLLFAAASGIEGGVAVYTPIEPLFAESDAVVVARCVSVERNDPAEPVERDGHLVPLDYILSYSTVKVYKDGKMPAAFRIFYPVRDPAEGTPGCGPGFALLFLKSGGSGKAYTLANFAFGLRQFPGRPSNGRVGLTLLEELETDAAGFLSSGGARAEMALRLLDDFDDLSEAGANALASFAGRLDPGASVLRLEILVRAGRPEYFEALVRELLDRPPAETPAGLCDALEKGRSAKDLPALEELERRTPADSPLRDCAVRGLRSLRTGAF